jgi:hypothetical protein
MAKPRPRRSGIQVELFPFLSVLACVIGTLVLLVILVTSSVLGDKRAITLVAKDAAGQNVTLAPRYVEVTGDGIILHPGGEFVAASAISRAGTPLRRLLEEVRQNRRSEYIIVAVRPEGFALFDRVRNQVEGRGIEIGYEPIDTDWTLKIRETR